MPSICEPLFYKAAILHLKRLRKRGELKRDVVPDFGDLRTEAGWDALIEHLESIDWVSFIQPPPVGSSGPSDLVRYLTRYLTNGLISDSRIVSADAHKVTFLAREGKVPGGESVQVPVTLRTTELVRRLCLHIQPAQLTKTRSFGGWGNHRLAACQESCVSMMNAAEVPLSAESLQYPPPECEPSKFECDASSATACPNGGEPVLRLLAYRPRPSCPEWLSRHSTHLPVRSKIWLERDDERFWDGCCGAGFNAWYLENVVENAYSSAGPTSATQPLLSGLEPSHRHALD